MIIYDPMYNQFLSWCDTCRYVNGFLVIYDMFLPQATECKNNSYIQKKIGPKYEVANDIKYSQLRIELVYTMKREPV